MHLLLSHAAAGCGRTLLACMGDLGHQSCSHVRCEVFACLRPRSPAQQFLGRVSIQHEACRVCIRGAVQVRCRPAAGVDPSWPGLRSRLQLWGGRATNMVVTTCAVGVGMSLSGPWRPCVCHGPLDTDIKPNSPDCRRDQSSAETAREPAGCTQLPLSKVKQGSYLVWVMGRYLRYLCDWVHA